MSTQSCVAKRYVPRVRRINVPLLLMLVGLNLVFVGLVWGQSSYIRKEAAGSGVWRFHISGYLLIVFGGFLSMLENHGGRIWKSKKFRLWFSSYMLIIAIMTARSLFWRAGLLQLLFYDLMPFALFLLVFMGQDERKWPAVNMTLIAHTLISISLYFYSLAHAVFIDRYSVVKTDLSAASAGLYAIPFLVLSYRWQPKIGKALAWLCLIPLVNSAVLQQSRKHVLVLLIVLLVTFYQWYRICGKTVAYRRVALLVVAIVALLAFAFNSGWGAAAGFRPGWDGLWRRLSGAEAQAAGMTYDNFRVDEALLVARSMSWDQWLIGSGVSGQWTDPSAYYGQMRSMVHIGFMHLVFKGGIGLLALFLYLPIATSIRRLISSHSNLVLGAASIGTLYFVNLFYGGAPEASPSFVILWLCAGLCVSSGGSESKEGPR